MRWLNKYHRGFNRLWLAVSIIGAVATVGVYARAGGYRIMSYNNFLWIDGRITVMPPGVYPPPPTESAKQKAYQPSENDKAYEAYVKKQKWITRGRFVRDLLGSFIIAFAVGHGVFLVVWWIIRGFR